MYIGQNYISQQYSWRKATRLSSVNSFAATFSAFFWLRQPELPRSECNGTERDDRK